MFDNAIKQRFVELSVIILVGFAWTSQENLSKSNVTVNSILYKNLNFLTELINKMYEDKPLLISALIVIVGKNLHTVRGPHKTDKNGILFLLLSRFLALRRF